MKTKKMIESYLSVFEDVVQFQIRLVGNKEANLKPINQIVGKKGLVNMIPFLKAKNYEGYNIYCRPIGWQYVLIDDLESREQLEQCATMRPSLLIETSPNNFQAWLHLERLPINRDHALQICLNVAEKLGADKGAAKPEQVGRLVGFTNRKPKHQRNDGSYPFVNLRRFEKRLSSYILPEYSLPKEENKPESHSLGKAVFCANNEITNIFNSLNYKHGNLSERDWHFIIRLKKLGFSQDEAENYLFNLTDEARLQKKPKDYIKRTASKIYNP